MRSGLSTSVSVGTLDSVSSKVVPNCAAANEFIWIVTLGRAPVSLLAVSLLEEDLYIAFTL